MKRAIWLAVGVALGATVPAVSQTFSIPGTSGSWRSTCERPAFDVDAQDGSRGAREAEVEFVEYKLCVTRQAHEDASRATRRILDDAGDELRDAERDASIWGFIVQ